MSDEEKLARAKSRAGRLLSEMRWAGTTPEERSKFAARVASCRTPEQMGAARKDPIKARCLCGLMTLARAKARCHRCVAPPPGGAPIRCCYATFETLEDWQAHAGPHCQPMSVKKAPPRKK